MHNALGIISKARADIGAQQNGLEHTINNNGATVENTQAAESRIRDTDMAKEMVSLSINNISILWLHLNLQPLCFVSCFRCP